MLGAEQLPLWAQGFGSCIIIQIMHIVKGDTNLRIVKKVIVATYMANSFKNFNCKGFIMELVSHSNQTFVIIKYIPDWESIAIIHNNPRVDFVLKVAFVVEDIAFIIADIDLVVASVSMNLKVATFIIVDLSDLRGIRVAMKVAF